MFFVNILNVMWLVISARDSNVMWLVLLFLKDIKNPTFVFISFSKKNYIEWMLFVNISSVMGLVKLLPLGT